MYDVMVDMQKFIGPIVTFILMLIGAYFLPGDPRNNIVGVLFGTAFFAAITFLLKHAVDISLELTILFMSVFAFGMIFFAGPELRSIAIALLIWLMQLYISRNFQKFAKGVSYKRKL